MDIAMLREGNQQFALITFETAETLAKSESLQRIKQDLAKLNIHWYPCQWHPGTNMSNKLIDFFSSFYQIIKLRIAGYRHVISLASVAGSYAYLYSVALRMKLYLYQYEPHSEYELDSGTYTKDSLTFKLLNFLEKRSAMYATVISSGTGHMMERLKNWKVKAGVFKIPSVVNDQKFIFSEEDRNEIRKKYGIPYESLVLYYPGKFGGLYYGRETVAMFRILLNKDSRFHVLVVTPNDLSEIEKFFLKEGIEKHRYTLTHAAFDVIQKYHSAADFAIIAAPPGPSKKFVSNIKVGEYLCSGLPYLICKGVSEDDEYAKKYNVGVVVKDFDEIHIEKAYNGIENILALPTEFRREYCRKVGIEYRGFKYLKLEFRKAFNLLMSS